MTGGKRKPIATIRTGEARGAVPYFIAVAAVSIIVGYVAGQVPAIALATGLAACLTLLGVYLFTQRRREVNIYARWRNLMPCYLSVQDRDLRITDINDLFKRDFGDRVGEFCYRAYKGAAEPCAVCPVLQTFADGEIHTSEETVIDRDGKEGQVLVTSAPLYDDDDEIVGVVEMSTNITEARVLRRELASSRRNYKQLFESVPCHICVLDSNLEIIESNLLYKADFDVKRGAHCYEACKRRKSSCPECLVEKTFEDSRVHSSEESLNTRDGRELDLVVHSMPIRGEDNRITAVMEVFTDITQVKQLQRQLTLMGRAVAGMAHRIKNLLMGLEGGIFVVNTGMELGEQETVEEGWEMVERNVKTVSRLVKDLLFCSKEREPEFEDDVSPGEVLEEVGELYAKRVEEDDIELTVEVDPEIRPGRFDPDGLHNMLSNLVANAIDACRFDLDERKETHHISLSCRTDGSGSIVYEVEDDGAGIPEDQAEKVFLDFFSTKGTEGTGVGLLVVAKVADEHGGGVTFKSEEGKGTRFKVTIPASRS